MYSKGVSVILATYNGSKYIIKQIDSILAQSIPPEEFIICDDCSTDGTVHLLQPYLKNYSIKLFTNEKRLGVVENFRRGVKLAQKGNWLAFSDQDDIWVPQKLEKLKEAMKFLDDGLTPALIYSDLSVIDKDDKVIYESFWEQQKIKPKKIALPTLLYGNVVTGCSMIINYAMAEEFLYMNNVEYLHDEWLALIAYSFGKAKFLNEKLVLYRQHENNVTFSENYETQGILKRIKNEIDYFSGKKKFLFRQFEMAKMFLLKYRSKLNSVQINIIENFIKLENKNYLLKRIVRRITYS